MQRHIKIAPAIIAFSLRKSTMFLLLVVVLCKPLLGLDDFSVRQSIIIINPLSFNRTNEIIAVERNVLDKVSSHLFPSIKKNNDILVTQLIDKNGDGTWDVLLVEVSLAANSTDTLQLHWIKKEAQVQQLNLTNVRLSLRSGNNIPSPEIYTTKRSRGFTQNIAQPYYQMEGPGLENDKVAFRAFFDSRNGKDIYGKIVDTPVLDTVGVGASWHNLQPWGMDILKVGNSLGAGALAVEENEKIYRLADADTTVFQSLYEGALQAGFQLRFKNWDVGTGRQNGSETMSVSKGDFYYKNDIAVSLGANQNLVAGIAHFGTDSLVYKKHNAVFSSISVYGKQAEGTMTHLGLAIMFCTTDYVANKTADTASVIPNTAYVALKPVDNKKKFIYFFACWENTDDRFKTQQGFEDYLQTTAGLLANPIQIKIIPNNLL